MTTTRQIGVGVIGAGINSRRNHLPTLMKLQAEGQCRLVMLADLNRDLAKQCQEQYGFEAYTHQADQVVEHADIDAIYICGTVQLHEQYLFKALNAGKHVFVEKPATTTVAKSFEALVLSRKKNLQVAVGHNRRFYKNLNYVLGLMDPLHDIKTVEGIYHKPFLNADYMHGCSSWVTYSALHGIDGVVYTMQRRPTTLFTATNIASGAAKQNVSALLIWENGAHGVVSSNNSAGSRNEAYTIHTAGRTYTCDQSHKVIVSDQKNDEIIDLGTIEETRGFYDEHVEFLKAISEGGPLRNSLAESIVNLHIAELIEQNHQGEIDWEFLDRVHTDAPLETVKTVSEVSVVSSAKVATDARILVLNPNTLAGSLAKLSERYTVTFLDELTDLADAEKAKIVAIISGSGGVAVADDMLAQCPNLSVVGMVGASVKKYNPEAIIEKGIPIINTSDVFARAVAEFNLLQMLVGVKNASRSHDVMRKGGWGITAKPFKTELIKKLRKYSESSIVQPIRPLLKMLYLNSGLKKGSKTNGVGAGGAYAGGRNISELTVGIIGYGAISRQFIALLKKHGCQIRVHSQYLTEELATKHGVEKTSLLDTLNADVVSLHRGLSEKTKHSFSTQEIAALKPGSVFINAARGAIIDEPELIKRLHKGDIFACLDVFADEPLPKNSPLRKMPNVFLTSHIAGVTNETFADSPPILVEKILAYLSGEPVDNLITTREMVQNMT